MGLHPGRGSVARGAPRGLGGLGAPWGTPQGPWVAALPPDNTALLEARPRTPPGDPPWGAPGAPRGPPGPPGGPPRGVFGKPLGGPDSLGAKSS